MHPNACSCVVGPDCGEMSTQELAWGSHTPTGAHAPHRGAPHTSPLRSPAAGVRPRAINPVSQAEDEPA